MEPARVENATTNHKVPFCGLSLTLTSRVESCDRVSYAPLWDTSFGQNPCGVLSQSSRLAPKPARNPASDFSTSGTCRKYQGACSASESPVDGADVESCIALFLMAVVLGVIGAEA